MRRLAGLLVLGLGLLLADMGRAADRLGSWPVDTTQISVSGLSSGAFMAAQLHVAHAADIMGVGLVAGGLHNCALETAGGWLRGSSALAQNDCMRAPQALKPAATYADRVRRFAAEGWVDPVEAIAHARLYAFTGKADRTVSNETVRRAVEVYRLLGIPAAATRFSDTELEAGHGWVTPTARQDCPLTSPPFINHCRDYDQSREILETIYGRLQGPRARPAGRLLAFDQTEFAPPGDIRHGLWHTGYLYVPPACAAPGATPCRLHVVLHGCRQSAEALRGDLFPRSIGMNEWADANRILVLYPQARRITVWDFRPPGWRDLDEINLYGCWNWWGYGYDDEAYLFKDGVQVSAIWAMVQRVAGRLNR